MDLRLGFEVECEYGEWRKEKRRTSGEYWRWILKGGGMEGLGSWGIEYTICYMRVEVFSLVFWDIGILDFGIGMDGCG